MVRTVTFPDLADNHVDRCYRLRYGNSTGTCFIHCNNGIVAFVTAKHVIKDLKIYDKVALLINDEWDYLTVEEIKFHDAYDCAVFTVGTFLISNTWEDEPGRMILGHPVVYLGFPHGLTGNHPVQLGGRSPLVKVAHYSGLVEVNGISLMALDGINNPGFSGGPIFAHGLENSDLSLIGLINGYRFEQPSQGKVFKRGVAEGAEDTDLYVKMNSGIIYATPVGIINSLFKDMSGLFVEPKM